MTFGAVHPRGPHLGDVPPAAQRGRRRALPLGLLVLVLAAQVVALPAPASATSAPAGVGGGSPGARPRSTRGKRSTLEVRVARLTKALDLDPEQQAAVRKALQEQQQKVQQIWKGEAPSAADRIAATRKLSTQTADHIRAVLSEEQRKKFDPPEQPDHGTATAGVHVEDWLKAEARH